MDENQDGQVSKEEFVSYLKKFVLKQAHLSMTSVPADHSQAMTLLNEAMNRTFKKVLEDVAQVVGMKGDAEVDQPNPNLEDFEKPLMLTEETIMQIQTLWLILDKTGDDSISKDDFLALARACWLKHGGAREYTEGELATALRNYEAFHRLPFGSATVEQLQSSSANIGGWLRDGIQQEAIAKWHEMSRHFDADHSGDITPVEFIDGFKKKAMGEALDWEGIKSMPEQTYLDVQAKINESVNLRLQNHVKMARAYLAQDAVPPSGDVELSPPWNTEGWKRVSTRLADQLRVNTENLEKIEEIFNHLDQTKDGVLTKDDFRPTTSGEVSLRDDSGSPPFGRRSPPTAPRPPPAPRSVRRQVYTRAAFESL